MRAVQRCRLLLTVNPLDGALPSCQVWQLGFSKPDSWKGAQTLNGLLSSEKRREAATAYVFILPFFLGMIVFYLIPILTAFANSFTEWAGYTNPVFTGLTNYKALFADEALHREIWNTLRYILMSLPVTILIALVFAQLLNSNIRGKGIYRVLYYLPCITMSAVVVLIWRQLLNGRFGLVSVTAKSIFGSCPAFLSDPKYCIYSLVMMSVWSSLGYDIIFLLAGLQSIPEVYSEACRVDGGNAATCFFRIKLPLITPTLFYLLVTGIISGFNQYDYSYMLSSLAGSSLSAESPIYDALRTVVTGIYNSGFVFHEMGYACTKSVVLFCMILIVTVFQFVFQKRWVNY